MHYVYILKSEKTPNHYVGATSDLRLRLKDHNEGKQRFTQPHRPWTLAWYAGFPSKAKAMTFEKYLKSGSGHAFRNRHLI
ncbi:MAG: GIY-YIG nuclease family protein [Candidatus Methylacidiphilales bacterium]|nr:GIY-YIG nuclease family protein [Candidatus Methylacidiphilales bacterium]